jgi:hypothetical protein
MSCYVVKHRENFTFLTVFMWLAGGREKVGGLSWKPGYIILLQQNFFVVQFHAAIMPHILWCVLEFSDVTRKLDSDDQNLCIGEKFATLHMSS